MFFTINSAKVHGKLFINFWSIHSWGKWKSSATVKILNVLWFKLLVTECEVHAFWFSMEFFCKEVWYMVSLIHVHFEWNLKKIGFHVAHVTRSEEHHHIVLCIVNCTFPIAFVGSRWQSWLEYIRWCRSFWCGKGRYVSFKFLVFERINSWTTVESWNWGREFL